MKRHLYSKHPQDSEKEQSFFRRKAEQLKKNRFDSGGVLQQSNKSALTASYTVSLKISQAKKPQTIGEVLLLPCVKTIVKCMIGDDAVRKISFISLSNDTVFYSDIC